MTWWDFGKGVLIGLLIGGAFGSIIFFITNYIKRQTEKKKALSDLNAGNFLKTFDKRDYNAEQWKDSCPADEERVKNLNRDIFKSEKLE